MKRFKFSLQTVLDTKLAKEEEAQRRLAEGWRQLQLEIEERQRLQTAILVESTRIEDTCGHQTYKQDLLRHVRYRQALQDRERKQEELIKVCQVTVEQLREKLRALMAERKSLDNLKAMEHKTWRIDMNRLEQKDMDEISIQRFFRRAIEASAASTT